MRACSFFEINLAGGVNLDENLGNVECVGSTPINCVLLSTFHRECSRLARELLLMMMCEEERELSVALLSRYDGACPFPRFALINFLEFSRCWGESFSTGRVVRDVMFFRCHTRFQKLTTQKSKVDFPGPVATIGSRQ